MHAAKHYISLQRAEAIRQYILQKSPETDNDLSLGTLLASLRHVQHTNYYPTFSQQIAYLFYTLTKNPASSDGYMRLALALTLYFAKLNTQIDTVRLGLQLEPIVKATESGFLSQSDIKAFFDTIFDKKPMPEECLLHFARAFERLHVKEKDPNTSSQENTFR